MNTAPNPEARQILTIRNPVNDDEFSARHHLLTATLRGNFQLSYPIEDEYPFLLNRKNSARSFCLFSEAQKLVAHANLFERSIVKNGKEIHRVGVISNVATLPSEQGKGYGKHLLQNLVNESKRRDLDAVFLWSELDHFYLSLGFKQFGKEERFTLRKQITSKKTCLAYCDPLQVGLDDLEKFLAMRPQVATMLRTPEQFHEFLQIPDTHLLVKKEYGKISGYAIYGKGADLTNVIHEFGADDFSKIHTIVEDASEIVRRQFGEAVVLAPAKFLSLKGKKEVHPMAWILQLKDKPLENFFFWGLDSN